MQVNIATHLTDVSPLLTPELSVGQFLFFIQSTQYLIFFQILHLLAVFFSSKDGYSTFYEPWIVAVFLAVTSFSVPVIYVLEKDESSYLSQVLNADSKACHVNGKGPPTYPPVIPLLKFAIP